MALSNYGELKTEIANLIHRTDLTTYIPYFIQYAETVIGGDPEPNSMDALPGIRVRNQQKRVTTDTTTQYIDTPTDMLNIKDIQINISPIQTLTYLSPKQMTAKFPSSPAGTPTHYTLHGDEIQFSHVPDSSLELEISYIARDTAFSGDTDTNWLMTNHPFAYLYAAMIAASTHVDEDPTKWAMLYKSIASGINHTEKSGNYGALLASRPHTATP